MSDTEVQRKRDRINECERSMGTEFEKLNDCEREDEEEKTVSERGEVRIGKVWGSEKSDRSSCLNQENSSVGPLICHPQGALYPSFSPSQVIITCCAIGFVIEIEIAN